MGARGSDRDPPVEPPVRPVRDAGKASQCTGTEMTGPGYTTHDGGRPNQMRTPTGQGWFFGSGLGSSGGVHLGRSGKAIWACPKQAGRIQAGIHENLGSPHQKASKSLQGDLFPQNVQVVSRHLSSQTCQGSRRLFRRGFPRPARDRCLHIEWCEGKVVCWRPSLVIERP